MTQSDEFGNFLYTPPPNNQPSGYPVPQPQPYSYPIQDNRNTDYITRLLAANAVVQGSGYRRQIIEHVRDPFTAATPELGMDGEFVYRVAQHIENRIAQIRAFYFLVVFVCGILFILGSTASECGYNGRRYFCDYGNSGVVLLAIIGFLVASAILTFFSRRILRNDYLGFFKPNSPTWHQAKQHFNISVPATPPVIPQPNQNAVVYSGFSPFVGAGVFLGGWSFPVDLGAYKDDLGNLVEPTPFTLAELYAGLTQSIQNLGFDHVDVRDYLFTHGLDVTNNQLAFLPATLEQSPSQVLPPQAIDYYANTNDHSVRFYKWIRIYDWRGEVIFSFFVRFSFRGRNLFMEFNSFLLPPLKPYLYVVDYVQNIGIIRQIISAFNPFIPVVEAVIFLNRISNWLRSLIGLGAPDVLQEKLRMARKDLRRGLPFNYGKSESLREKFSHSDYTRFFQVMDKEMYTKIIEKEMISYIGKFLASKKVNTTQFEERARTIVNNGLMVGGDFEISGGAIAFGEGAKAKNIVNRAQDAVKSMTGQSDK
ncbi:MAG: hypothetical protein SFZ02_03525 [bacterium]|nr:hypothetical protein [bacterium]